MADDETYHPRAAVSYLAGEPIKSPDVVLIMGDNVIIVARDWAPA